MILLFVSKPYIFSFLLSNNYFPGSLESWLLFMFCGYEIQVGHEKHGGKREREDFLVYLSLLVIDSWEVASLLHELEFGQIATVNPLDGPHNNGWVVTFP